MFSKIGLTSVLSAMLMAGTALTPAYAQDNERQFSAAAGEVVNETMILANEKNYEAAVSSLRDLIGKTDLNPYERSTIYQMIGQYSYELGQSEAAQKAFENALNAGGLLPTEVDNIKVVVAQLMIGNGQFREGSERLEGYLNSGGQKKAQYVDLLVNGWIQAEDYKRALPWAETWFDVAAPKQRKHFDLMNFLYNNLGQPARQADIVKQMIDRWPDDKALWESWASMLANGGRERDAFEVTKIMYLKGMLTTEPELLKVVQYYSFYDMPFQAAQILELEMEASRISQAPDHLKKLSGLYRQAREYKRAIPILENAASLSGEAATFAELGEALYNDRDCRKSELAFTEAMNRGYDAGKSWMLIASCRYDAAVELDRLNCGMSDKEMSDAPITRARISAIEAFENVPKRSAEYGNAQTWMQFIETEKQAVKLRCDFEGKVKKDECLKQIKQAYEGMIFTREFKLDDPSCQTFVTEYDAEYRQPDSSE